MIELTPATGFMLYLGLTIGALLGLWLWHNVQSRSKKVVLSDQELSVCEYCHYAYLQEKGKKISKCPQCQSFNKH